VLPFLDFAGRGGRVKWKKGKEKKKGRKNRGSVLKGRFLLFKKRDGGEKRKKKIRGGEEV